jgi:hypothetical protein
MDAWRSDAEKTRRCERAAIPLLGILTGLIMATRLAGGAIETRKIAVFFRASDLERAKERSQRLLWARKAWEKIRLAADDWIASPTSLPDGPTGLYQDYFCPDHGVRLRYDSKKPREHVCPEDGRVWQGPKLDGYWVSTTIRKQLEAAVCCGIAWRLTGREEYAQAAARILRSFADHYHARVAPRNPRRWMRQSLDEATCILDAVRVFELVSDSNALNPDQARVVVEGYLLPTARFLATERRSIHNIDSWINTAILAVGAVTGEVSLLDFALGGTTDSRHGLRDQIREGVTGEGLWREGSLAYHYYVLSSLGEALLATRDLPVDLSLEREKVKGMYLAPFALTDDRWVIPATNDGQPSTLDRFAQHYETAAALFPEEPLFADFLAAACRRNGGKRAGIEALLYGPEELPGADASIPTQPSRVFTESGFAVLRSRAPHPQGGEVYAFLDFGPPGGVHGHPDKHAVSLHALGRVLAPDLGTSGYGISLSTAWYRQTLSHNTVVVDRRSQRPATGMLLSFHGQGPVQHAIASAGEACPGMEWTRGVFLAEEGYLVILDRIAAKGGGLLLPMKHVFDWVWHSYGTLEVTGMKLTPLSDRVSFGMSEGYQVPDRISVGRPAGPVTARWVIEEETPTQPAGQRPRTSGSVRLWLASDGDLEVFTGSGPGNPAKDRLPFILARRAGPEARFRAVLEPVPAGGKARVQGIEWTGEGLRIITATGAREVILP